MLKNMLKRLMHSVKGHQHHKYDSSDYKYKKHRGPFQNHNHSYPPQRYGHKHYKSKSKSFSSYFSS